MSMEKVLAIAKKQNVSFLGSMSGDGFPKVRAMLPPCRWDGNQLYYHTNTSSGKIAEFRQTPKACAYFCDSAHFRGALLVGEVEVLEDSPTKEAFWKDSYAMYYPGGAADPDFCVLRFTAHRGELYGNFQVQHFAVE